MNPTTPLPALTDALARTELKELDGTMLSLLLRSDAAARGWDVLRISLAIDMAAYAHRNQLRRNRGVMALTHYIEHPLRNAARLVRYGVTDEDLVIAAILHDVVEDAPAEVVRAVHGTEVTPVLARTAASAAIGEVFDTHVRELVDAVTNPPSTVKLSHVAYRAHVEEAIADPEVLLVKATDLIDNAGGLVYLLGSPANTSMVANLARKYSPLLPVVATRAMQDDVAALVSPDGHRRMLNSLAHTMARLEEILAAE